MPSKAPECLTIPEVADELRVCRSSVYNLIKRGLLRTIPVLGKKRVRRRELDRYLDLISSPAFQRAI